MRVLADLVRSVVSGVLLGVMARIVMRGVAIEADLPGHECNMSSDGSLFSPPPNHVTLAA